nr:extensin family protein [Brucella daejeonensis]
MLKQDAHKARQRSKAPSAERSGKAPVRRRGQTVEKRDTGPGTVPVSTPAPRPAHTPEKPEERETAPVPAEPPRRAEKPEAPTTEPAPPQAKPEKDERVYQVSCPALISGDVAGKLLPPIEDGEQCGAHSPLSLTAIGKEEPLKLANAITTNCAMAVTLAQWSVEVNKAVRDVYGTDVKISEIGTGSDYQCRKVNGGATGRVSEHAFANALDIMSFKFSDGSKTELETGWNGSDKEKTFWRAVHGASCGLFMTVIGPDGDAAHSTNMHLDQGCHGKSCLARICQ